MAASSPAASRVSGLSERQLFAVVHQRMRALVGGSAPDLDDLVQMAAEQVFRSVGSFDGRSELVTWVYAICYRVLLRQRRWYRRFQLRFTAREHELPVASDEPIPSALLEARERVQSLHRALSCMTDKYRAVVVLHDLEEHDIKNIASIVGAGELTVRSRLRDGRKQLHKLLLAQAALEPFGGRHELSQS